MHSLNVSSPAPPRSLFFALLLIFVWAPLPWGSYDASFLHLLCALIFLLAAAFVLSIGKFGLVPSAVLKKSWPVVIALILYQCWVAGQYVFGLTISPYDTFVDLQLGAAFTVFFVLCLQLVDSREKLQVFAMVFVMAGTFQAFYGAFMALSGLEYGFFAEKTNFVGKATGTYMARNHFAGFLEMSLAVGIGLMLSQLRSDRSKGWQDRWQRLLQTLLSPKFRLRLYLVIMVVALVLSRSRMGNTAFFVAVTICGVLALFFQWRYRQQRINRNIIVFFISMAVIDVLIVSNWFGIDKLVERMEATSAESELRDEAARDTLKLWSDNLITGSGAGSFEQAYPLYRGSDVHVAQFTAHNDYLEFGAETGLIGFTLLGFTVLFSLWQGLRAQIERQSRLLQGMGFASTMGIVSLLIHSAVDFNLQIPANALAFLVILAFACIARHLPSERAK